MAQGLQHIHDTIARDRAVIGLQKELLAAQVAQATLVDTIGNLKKRLTELEAGDAEKKRCKLTDIGSGLATCGSITRSAISCPRTRRRGRCLLH
jgi:hypothetical protein